MSAATLTAPPAPAAASIFAVELLAELIRRGVSDVVVCPGSRSQALALAAAAAEQAGAIRLHVRVDERSAAFFALGVARETGMPAPIIVTSGTAVANLHPAALEAHEGRVPFIALTADRPAASRGTRASQTTKQAHMFGEAARLSLDVPPPAIGANGDLSRDFAVDPQRIARRALSAALGFPSDAPAGPVQVNLQFTEPLSGLQGFERMIAAGFTQAGEEGAEALATRARALKQGAHSRDTEDGWQTAFTGPSDGDASDNTVYVHDDTTADADLRTVVVAGASTGAEAGAEALAFAHAAGLPLLAEVVSGARAGSESITSYATLLGNPELGGRTERAIIFGHPTLTRQIPALLGRDGVEVIVVDAHTNTDHYLPTAGVRVVRAARVASSHDPSVHQAWLDAWKTADRALAEARTAAGTETSPAASEPISAPITRAVLVEQAWLSTQPHDRLVLAASRLVRVLDGLASARNVTVHSNRGLAGIDGTIATALGVAVTSQAVTSQAGTGDGITRVIIGDVALLHDASSLLLPPEGEQAPRIQLIVGNDTGGTIFDMLEVKGTAEPAAYERVMLTPNRADLESLAKAYGWAYERATTRVELEQLIEAPGLTPTLIEVPLEG